MDTSTSSGVMQSLLPLLMVGFVACWGYGMYCWTRVVRNRQPGAKWWSPVPFSGETLTDTGRSFLKRFYVAMAVGVGIVVVALVLYPAS